MSYDLTGLADNLPDPQAPASAPTPAAAPDDVAVPAPSKYNLAPLADDLAKAREAQANAVNSVAQMGDADKAARAEAVGKELGVPGVVAATNLPAFEQRLAIQKSSQVLAQSPGLQDWLVQNPDKAVMAKDDYANLSIIEKLAKFASDNSFSEGVKEGAAADQRGILYQKMVSGSATDEDRAHYDALKMAAESAPKTTGMADAAVHFVGSIAGALGATAASPEAAGTMAAGAAVGAGAGALAGGIGAVPGGIAGGGLGFNMGAIWHGVKSGIGQAAELADSIRDEYGQPLNDWSKLGMMAVGGTVQGAMSKFLGGAAIRAGQTALRDIMTRPDTMAVLEQYGKQMAAGAAHTGAMFGAAALANNSAEQVARIATNLANDGQFKDIANDEGERERFATSVLTESLKGAAFGTAMHGVTGLVGAGRGLLAVRDSERMQQTFQGLADAAPDSKLRERSPDAFREFLQQQVGDGPFAYLEIPAAKIMDLYQGAHVDPFSLTEDPIFGFDPEFKEKLREANENGGYVRVSMADYVAHIAGTDVDKMLRRDIAPGGGYSLNDIDEARKDAMAEYNTRVQEHMAEMERQGQAEGAPRDAREAVYRDALTKLRANADMGPQDADFNARAVAAHYAAKADIWNKDRGPDFTDAMEQYRKQDVDIQRTRSDRQNILFRHYDVGNTDALINDVRAGKSSSTKDMYGPQLTEWVSQKGGVRPEDAGDLKAMDLDKWHHDKPVMDRVIRSGGMSLEDMAQDALDDGFMPDVKARIDGGEQGVNLGKEFLDKLAQDQTGHGVRSEYLANHEAEAHEGALADIRKVLADEGIDVKTAGNETIKAALDEWKEKPAGGDEYEQAGKRLGYSPQDVAEARDVIEKVQAGEAVPGVTDEQRDTIARLAADVAGREGDQSASGNGEARPDGSAPGEPVTVAALREFLQRSGEPDDGTGGHDEGQGVAGRDVTAERSGGVLPSLADAPKGSILFMSQRGDRIRALINLFSGADKSTFMHESAHLWLEEMVRDAADPEAPQAFRDDLAKTLKWMDIDRPDQITDAHHEMFARAFEGYLMEGKAPSIELEPTFAKFKSWLLNIYQNLLGGISGMAGLSRAAGFEVRLDPDIREVFDRMLASEDEIKLARDHQQLKQLFKTAQDANMTEPQFQAYLKAVDTAKTAAVSALEKKAIADLQRQKAQEWKEQSDKTANEVAGEVDARPDIQAMQAYRTNSLPDGRVGQMPKMDRSAIVRMFGSDGIIKELSMGFHKIFAAKGGVHPDMIAEMFGMKDGRELLESLMNLKRQEEDARKQTGDKTLSIRRVLIDQETKARMLDRHGDYMNDGSIENDAIDALHNDRQGEVLAAELAALRSRPRTWTYQGQKFLLGAVRPMEIAKARALDIINGKRVRDVIKLTQYARAEAKAGRAAEQAMLKGDYEAAAKAKEQQMLAHAVWRVAKDAKEQVEQDQAYLAKFAKNPVIKAIDQDYKDQIDGMLERFDFKPASAKEVGRRESLAAWIARQEDDGNPVMISDKLRNQVFSQHYSEMSVEDMRDLADAVRNIDKLGRLKREYILNGQARELEAVKTALTDAAARHPQREITPEAVQGTREGIGGLLDRMGQKARSINAMLMKAEQMCLMLDNGDSNGPWNTYIFRPLKDATFKRYEYEARITSMLKSLKDALPKDYADGLGEHEFLPDQRTLMEPRSGLPMRFRKKDILGLMLNMGNDGNFDRLTEGYGGAKAGWSRDTVRRLVDQHATEADWKYVQGVWDIFESFKGEIADMTKKMTGVDMEEVKATPVTFKDGRPPLRGGYFPVIKDPSMSLRVEDRDAKATTQSLLGQGYASAITPKGHTKSRAEGNKDALYLGAVDLICHRLAQHIHDLAFRETILNVDKLLSSQTIADSVGKSLGKEYVPEMRKWLRDAAADRNISPQAVTGADRFFKAFRANMTAVGIGFRFTTFAKHATGALFNSIGELGPKWMAVGTKDVFGNPFQTAQIIEDIKARSPEMRYRKEQYDRDYNSGLQDLSQHVGLTSANGVKGGFVKMRDMWNHAGHWLVSEGDWLSALPTWQGAYKKALGDGMAEADAIYAAEQSVRNAHGAQSLIDRAGIQRTSEMMNCLTMFYGYFNHVWNRQVGMVDTAKYGIDKAQMGDWEGARKDFATVAWRSMFYVMIPALIEAAVTQALPSEDNDQSWFGWASKAVGEELMAGVPVLRDMGKAAIDAVTGKRHGFQASPMEGGIDTALQGLQDLSALFDDDKAMSGQTLKHLLTAAGMVSGVGTGAPASYAQYVFDVLTDKEHPEDAAEFTKHLLLGPPKK